MFNNYSQTYSAGIATIAGFAILLSNHFGLGFAEGDVVFALGVFANAGGVVWGLYHRFAKGGVNLAGVRQ